MATKRGLGRLKIWIPAVLLLIPAVVGYVLLRNAVEFFGVNRRDCTGAGRQRSCSTAEGGAQFDALFGLHNDESYVSSAGSLWAARACFAVYAVLILYVIGAWLVRRIATYGALRQSGMRGPKARQRRSAEQARKAKVASSLTGRRTGAQHPGEDDVDLTK